MMSTMARTEVRILREFAIQKAKSRSEFWSNLRSKDNNSNRTRGIIYEILGIVLKGFVDCLLKSLQVQKLCHYCYFTNEKNQEAE